MAGTRDRSGRHNLNMDARMAALEEDITGIEIAAAKDREHFENSMKQLADSLKETNAAINKMTWYLVTLFGSVTVSAILLAVQIAL